ncbi:Calx-beta domain-containing protein [Maribacter sp. SA7]|uniref:Calx-beta domain-containing protein n=1 Tax=Maribacter zhoushanensis TaxID=3030012 RepID=UPI0023EB0D4E|nr:Calx-beta domain-containing protein [Maribacter zhoushanensis]MDF4203137.1 Calx-beta domain-containing protein [Maribacter zhoushanensis]
MKKPLMYLSVAALLFSCTKTEEVEVEKLVEVPTAIDLSKVSLASSASMTTESDEQVIIISAAIEAAQEETVTIQLNFAGSAALNSDYSVSSSSITVPAGELTGTTELTIISDGVFESGVENIVISLAELPNTITPSDNGSFVQIDITDGEALLGFETSSITIEENSFYTLNFNLSKPLNEDIVVYYSSVTENSNYAVEGNGELIIQAGQSSKSVTVDANDGRITASDEKSIVVTINGVENDDVTIGSNASIAITTTEIDEGLQISSTWSTQSDLFELRVTDSNGNTVESASSFNAGSESLFINKLDFSPLTNGTYSIELIAYLFDGLTSETVTFNFLDEVGGTYGGPYTFIANNRFVDGNIEVFELQVLDGVYTITQTNTSN